MRDDRLRRGQRVGRVRERLERARPSDDELDQLVDRPGIDHRQHDGRRRGDAAAVQPARANEKEREDPPKEAVPVQIGEGDGNDRSDKVALLGDGEVELGVEVAESGEEIVQRERR